MAAEFIWTVARALIEFDTSGIPAGSDVLSVTLRLKPVRNKHGNSGYTTLQVFESTHTTDANADKWENFTRPLGSSDLSDLASATTLAGEILDFDLRGSTLPPYSSDAYAFVGLGPTGRTKMLVLAGWDADDADPRGDPGPLNTYPGFSIGTSRGGGSHALVLSPVSPSVVFLEPPQLFVQYRKAIVE